MSSNGDGHRIILASASPRRREIMQRLQIPCEFISADIDEEAIPYKTPRELAIKAAYAKACAVEACLEAPALIIAADTVVVLGRDLFGKPKDPAEAREMLGRLSGRAHTVISGVAVKEAGKMASLLDAEQTQVHIREMTSGEIAEYVATGEPLDKAGAYAAQGIGRRFIDRMEGDYFNVVGLPVLRMLDMLDMFTDTAKFRARLPNLDGFSDDDRKP